jgi:hypothetical protein
MDAGRGRKGAGSRRIAAPSEISQRVRIAFSGIPDEKETSNGNERRECEEVPSGQKPRYKIHYGFNMKGKVLSM